MPGYPQASPIVRLLIVGASIVIIVAGMQAAASILAPLLLALVIMAVISPDLQRIQERGVPPWLATVIMLAVLLVVGIALIYILYSSLSAFASRLPGYMESFNARVGGVGEWLAARGIDLSTLAFPNQVNPAALSQAAINGVQAIVAAVTQSLFVLAIVLLMSGEAPQPLSRLQRILRPENRFLDNFVRFSQSARSQFRISTLGNIIVSTIFTAGLFILGVDFPLLWWLLTFLLAYIPNIGVPLSAIPPTLLAFAQYGVGTAAIVLVLIVMLHIIWDNVVSPKVLGTGLALSPVIVFVSFVFWSWVFGITGALLAVPLTVVLKLLLESSEDTRWLARLMSSEPPSPPADDAKPNSRRNKHS
jgi:AI-2 transport protein TqsA